MIDLSKLANNDIGRCVRWTDVYEREGYLATWDTRRLVVDEELIGSRVRNSLRVFVDPKEAEFVGEEK